MTLRYAICEDYERERLAFCESCGLCRGCCRCAEFDDDVADDYASTPHPSAYYESGE